MRQYDQRDEDDRKTVADELIEPWMLECIARNPEYVHWGPYEDYMAGGSDSSWRGPIVVDTWAAFGPWSLDDLNECANFYFYAQRDSEECAVCGGSGLNAATKELSDNFYAHHLPHRSREWERTRWADKITQDEVQALLDAGRLYQFKGEAPTAAEVNAWERGDGPKRGGLGGHDAINRWILIKTRAKRLGVWGTCATCDGRGTIYTADRARLGLVLWMLHPRKGASRGVDVKNVTQTDVPVVLEWLREAAQRNAARFSKVSP